MKEIFDTFCEFSTQSNYERAQELLFKNGIFWSGTGRNIDNVRLGRTISVRNIFGMGYKMYSDSEAIKCKVITEEEWFNIMEKPKTLKDLIKLL